MTEYWNGGITGVSMNRGKSFLGVVWLAGFALVAQNAFALGLAKILSSAAQYRRQIGARRSVARQQSAGGDIGSAVHNDGSQGRLQTARGSGADGRALSTQYRRGAG